MVPRGEEWHRGPSVSSAPATGSSPAPPGKSLVTTTYMAVPRAMLERLGVPIQRSMPSQTADGRIVPVDIGQTIVRLEGFEFYTPVIFAAENEPSLLGVVTLEEAGLAVDPVNGRLIATHLLCY